MSPALTFREQMSGYVAFGDLPPVSGYELGRTEGTRLTLKMSVIVDNVDRFIAGPQRRAVLRGTVTFDELGGPFEIEHGSVRILPGRGDPAGRMYYSLGVRDANGDWLTIRGRKVLSPRRGTGVWLETRAMQTRVLRGGPPNPEITDDNPGPDDLERTIATGVVRLSVPGLARTLASFRPRARTRFAAGVAVARFWGAVAGAIADVYAPRVPSAEAVAEETEALSAVPAQPPPVFTVSHPTWKIAPLSIQPFEVSGSEARAAVEHVTAEGHEPSLGPVLLIAGSSVGASIFRPDGVPESVVQLLIRNGYDVWVENWRGSLGRDPVEYSLDEAAVLDHPRAVAEVARQTGSPCVKAVVHCLGSSGFMLALAGGLMHQDDFHVSHVVSNSVSLHPILPHAAAVKLRAFVPVYNRLIPYLDPQWARDREPMTDGPLEAEDGRSSVPGATPRTRVADVILEWVRLTHDECEDDICNFGQFMYGAGPSTLYDEETLEAETREWMRNQLAWAPVRLYRQISRSLLAGHLVPMREWGPRLPENLFDIGPPSSVDCRITFMTGAENRCFSPLSQRRTHEWFSAFQPRRHAFETIPGFGHLDPWIRADAGPVHEIVMRGLENDS